MSMIDIVGMQHNRSLRTVLRIPETSQNTWNLVTVMGTAQKQDPLTASFGGTYYCCSISRLIVFSLLRFFFLARLELGRLSRWDKTSVVVNLLLAVIYCNEAMKRGFIVQTMCVSAF